METDGIDGGLDAAADVDLSDETQDFRFLAAIAKKGGGGSIPKRGEKDFEPDGTNLQSSTLEDSRNAMFQALSVERTHTGKNRVTATWHPTRRLAKVHEQRGVLFKSMGRADSTGTTWLLPEELIYMVERGSLECFYDSTDVPMSVQAVYAAALAATGGLERYQVYANLRRTGYVVYRDPAQQYDELFQNVGYDYRPAERGNRGWGPQVYLWGLGIFSALFTSVFHGRKGADAFQAMVAPGAYRNYKEIYNRLLIPRRTLELPPTRRGDPLLNITFHVWKPRPNFKKSSPGPPDFYVTVLSTRDTKMPSLAQIEGLFNEVPEVASRQTGVYQLLKEGKKSVVLAVVDYGVISYMRFSDSRFLEHPLDVDPPSTAKGGKGKGRPPKKGATGNQKSKK
ncbi:tRNA-splicing endonuclease subunit sen54 [Orbilia brochopaga]|uniref:tRNA-splicing endonuclease subunit sen54 n=1 Tax=Orbilia brochopaga TaxID=3140254 RepID=A0AAV9UYQ1_9PEZI